MCGGAAPRPTIIEPNYAGYDSLATGQLQAYQMAQSPAVLAAQQGVQAEALRQQGVLRDLAEARTAAAANTSASASRLAALIGAPVPSQGAKAPVLGSNRSGMTRPSGRRGMRIDLQPTAAAGGIDLGGS
jgi:hypothetical protein